MKLKWLGHASFLIEHENLKVLIDPYDCAVEKADLILITHDHYDHFSKELIEEASVEDTEIIGPASVNKEVGGTLVKAGSEVELKGVKIEAVQAYNIKKSHHHAGDTDLVPEMNAVECDIALLPVGGTYTMDASEAASAAIVLEPNVVIPMHYGKIVGNEEDALHFKEGVEKEHSEIEVRVMQVGDVEEF